MTKKKEQITSEEAQEMIIEHMKLIGTYNTSFNVTVSILSKLLFDYENARDQWELEGSHMVIEYTNKAGNTNIIKDPLYQSMEKLRMDILTFLKELGLTPSGLKKIKQNSFDDVKSTSKFDELIVKVLS